ncbi:MAG TPA: SDR family NAD(P)-dependent oxidoreductase [Myxococcaceae bacterium]|jgi:3-oxoacyl-[acyl-carrier protein] reductase
MSRRVAIVTGAARGIGAEVAAALGRRGCALGLLDADGEALREFQARLEREGAGPLWGEVADVRDAGQVEAAFAESARRLGEVEILVNNVGGNTTPCPIEELRAEDWDAIQSLNLRSMFLCARAVVPAMKRRRWGRIVNVSSVAGRTRTLFSNAAYTAAKAGVIGFTRQCAAELAPYGIAVNAVAHGVIATDRVAAAWAARPEHFREQAMAMTPSGRLGTVEEAAAAVCFCCDEAAGYMAGAVIDVNGGLYIG